MTAVLLQFAPALVLALVLLAGRYPCEDALDELRRRAGAAAPAVVRRPASRWPRRERLSRRHRVLTGAAFSARPPPAG